MARCYRRHLETKHPVDPHLLTSMPAVEDALRVSHPGYFDMNLNDMDHYLLTCLPLQMATNMKASSLVMMAAATALPTEPTAANAHSIIDEPTVTTPASLPPSEHMDTASDDLPLDITVANASSEMLIDTSDKATILVPSSPAPGTPSCLGEVNAVKAATTDASTTVPEHVVNAGTAASASVPPNLPAQGTAIPAKPVPIMSTRAKKKALKRQQ